MRSRNKSLLEANIVEVARIFKTMAGRARYLPMQQMVRRQLEPTGSATTPVQSDSEIELQGVLLGTKQPLRASMASSSAAPTPVSQISPLQLPRNAANVLDAAELEDSQAPEGENSEAEKPPSASEPALACRMCHFWATTKRELAVHLLSDSHIALKKLFFPRDRKKPRSEAALTSSTQPTARSPKKVEAGAEIDDTVSLLLAAPSTSAARNPSRNADAAQRAALRRASAFSPPRTQEDVCSLAGTKTRKLPASSAPRTISPVNLPEASPQRPEKVLRVVDAPELSDVQSQAALKPSLLPETAGSKQQAAARGTAAAGDVSGASRGTPKSKAEQLADAWLQQQQDLPKEFSDLLSPPPPAAGFQSTAPFAQPCNEQAAANGSTGLQGSTRSLSIYSSKPAAKDKPRSEGQPAPQNKVAEAPGMGLEATEGSSKAAADGAESAAGVSPTAPANTPRKPESSADQRSYSHSSRHWQYLHRQPFGVHQPFGALQHFGAQQPFRPQQPLGAHQHFGTLQHFPWTHMNTYQMGGGGPWHLPNSAAALNMLAALLGLDFPLLPGYGDFYGGMCSSYGEGLQNPYMPGPTAFPGEPFPAPSQAPGTAAFPQPPAAEAKPSSCKPVITELKPSPAVASPGKIGATKHGTDNSTPVSIKKKKHKAPASQAAVLPAVWVPVKSGGGDVVAAPKSDSAKPAPCRVAAPDKFPAAPRPQPPSKWAGQSSVASQTLPLKPVAAKQPSVIEIERPISFDRAPGTEPVCPITLDFMQDPMVAEDGYTYEARAIRRWLMVKGTSPMTGQKIGNTLIKNRFANMLSMYHNRAAGTQC